MEDQRTEFIDPVPRIESSKLLHVPPSYEAMYSGSTSYCSFVWMFVLTHIAPIVFCYDVEQD